MRPPRRRPARAAAPRPDAPSRATPGSELVAHAEPDVARHDEAAVRRRERARVALGQRLLVRDVVGRDLHDERLVDAHDDAQIQLVVALEDVDVQRLAPAVVYRGIGGVHAARHVAEAEIVCRRQAYLPAGLALRLVPVYRRVTAIDVALQPGRVDRHREAAVGLPDPVELHALGFLRREDGLTAELEVDGPRIDIGEEGRGIQAQVVRRPLEAGLVLVDVLDQVIAAGERGTAVPIGVELRQQVTLVDAPEDAHPVRELVIEGRRPRGLRDVFRYGKIDRAGPPFVERIVDLVLLVADPDVRPQRVGDVEGGRRVQRVRRGVAAPVDVVVEAAAVDRRIIAGDAGDDLACLLDDLVLGIAQRPEVIARDARRVVAERRRTAFEVPCQADVVREGFDILEDFPGAELLDEFVAADIPPRHGALDQAGDYRARIDGRIGEQRADLHGAAVRNEAGRIGVSARQAESIRERPGI